MKIQMVDLLHRKLDVYIRQLQVRMPIFAITPKLPSGLFAEPLDSGGVDDVDRPKSAGEFRL